MANIKIFSLFGISAVISFTASGQTGTPIQKMRSPSEAKVIMTCPWDVGNIIVKCGIIETEDSSGYKVRELNVKFRAKRQLIEKNIYESIDYPIAMFPYGDSHGLLFTIWTSGSAYRIRIFRFLDQEIDCVLDDGSKVFPELVNDSEMHPCLIYAKTLSFIKSNYMKPDSCIIKRWYKDKYYSVGTFPWKERMQAIGLK